MAHGLAVLYGMLSASYLSYQQQLLSENDYNRIKMLITLANLPKQPESLPPIDLGEETQEAPADGEDDTEGNEPAEDDSDDSFQLQDPNATTFKLQVPDNARVFVNDRETTSTGSERVFSAANLDPNQQYRFRVRVEWTADGQQLISNRTLVLRPGTLVSVNMRSSGVDLMLPTAVQK